nr:MAG TPA: hypothetical protein [Caudoviricetes sp.]
MNWIIVIVAGIIVICVSHWIWYRKDFFLGLLVEAISIIAVVTAAVVILVGVLETPQSINNFNRQKAYIEMHEAKNAVEDAALTSKKIELNEWLYDAQCSKSRFGSWSIYPDSIFDLEPIE